MMNLWAACENEQHGPSVLLVQAEVWLLIGNLVNAGVFSLLIALSNSSPCESMAYSEGS